MSRVDRGGQTLKTGKIGRVNCIRQQIMMPGERMNIGINGKIRLESLRERDVMRINAHLAVFAQPLRWLVSNWTDYVKEGSDTAQTIPSLSSEDDWAKYGIGSYAGTPTASMDEFWKDALIRIHSEWYKWPEDGDISTWPTDGAVAMPLAKPWNRCRYDSTPDDSTDYTVTAASDFDVRDLAVTQAKFRGAMKRDVLSYNRWIELVQQTWKGDGSREVDKVPMMLDQVEVGVNPREIPATDGASLGQWQSLFDFGVNHGIRGVVAPEHMIISYMLTVRFASVTEAVHPLATTNLNWFEKVADPEWIASKEPVQVQRQDVQQNNSSTVLGYLPAGWQWRCDHDVIGQRVDQRDSFPYMLNPTTQAEAKDATRVKDAFRSQALGDYLVDLFISEDSYQPIGDSMDSYFSGMLDDNEVSIGGRGDEFPHGGKML